jgi:cobalamin biosynthesis protein CobW
MPPVEDAAAFCGRLADVAAKGNVLRMKGFLTVENKRMRLAVQGVGPRIDSYFDRPLRDEERMKGHLVIIGLKGLDRAQIASELGGTPE